jgi:hypothetical protein
MLSTRSACLAVALSSASALPAAAYTVTYFGPATWQASDAMLDVADCVIEDFEDVDLLPNMTVQIAEDDGSFAAPPENPLARTFDPVTDDPFGSAFVSGVWDGSHVLVNTVGNQSGTYIDSTVWRDIRFTFSGVVRKVGFSLDQAGLDHAIVVNGVLLTTFSSLVGFVFGSDRNGYLVVRAEEGDADISTLDVAHAGIDGFVFDHVAVGAAVEPVEPTTWGRVKALWSNTSTP